MNDVSRLDRARVAFEEAERLRLVAEDARARAAYIPWGLVDPCLRAEFDQIQNVSIPRDLTIALGTYLAAEDSYLQAVHLYHIGEASRSYGTPLTSIQDLPSPLGQELALLHQDYLREYNAIRMSDSGPHAELEGLHRLAEYVSALRDRVGQSLQVSPALENEPRGRSETARSR